MTPSLVPETEALKEAYAALNRNDIPAMVQAFDPQIVRIEPPEFPAGGTYQGFVAVQKHFSQARDTWPRGVASRSNSLSPAIRSLFTLCASEAETRNGMARRIFLADVFTFHNGKAVEMRTFADRQQALEWADVKA